MRINQKNLPQKIILEKLLRKQGYHFRYDSYSFVIGNRKETRIKDFKIFEKQILPYMKHEKKKKEAKELFDGILIQDSFKSLLEIIVKNPGITHNELLNFINKKKCYRELKALKRSNFIKYEEYPYKYFITVNGLKWIDGGR